ncbi:TPA: hypothetical protein ACGUU0_004081 [Vibrio vulnificus]
MKISLTERWEGTQLEQGFLVMLAAWAALAAGWVLAFEHNFNIDITSIVPSMFSVIEAKNYIIPKMGLLMSFIGLLVGYRFTSGKGYVLGKLLAVFGLFQLLYPSVLLAGAVTTDSKFAQLIAAVICLSLPIAVASWLASFLLPKSANSQSK